MLNAVIQVGRRNRVTLRAIDPERVGTDHEHRADIGMGGHSGKAARVNGGIFAEKSAAMARAERDRSAQSPGDAAAERRIKEQAKARAVDDYQRQEKTKQKAEEYRASGEYDKAEAEYEKALEIGERLALLEQEESVEQKRTNEALALEYKSVQDVKKRRSSSFGGKRSKKKEAKAGRFASFGPGSTDDATVADGSELQGPEGEGGGEGGGEA